MGGFASEASASGSASGPATAWSPDDASSAPPPAPSCPYPTQDRSILCSSPPPRFVALREVSLMPRNQRQQGSCRRRRKRDPAARTTSSSRSAGRRCRPATHRRSRRLPRRGLPGEHPYPPDLKESETSTAQQEDADAEAEKRPVLAERVEDEPDADHQRKQGAARRQASATRRGSAFGLLESSSPCTAYRRNSLAAQGWVRGLLGRDLLARRGNAGGSAEPRHEVLVFMADRCGSSELLGIHLAERDKSQEVRPDQI